MTQNRIGRAIERARSRRPITWITLVGVLLLPVLVGGILIAALYQPTQRLDRMTAAIVNQDEAVTIGGQLAPLGRQLTAGLVKGGSDKDGNLDWVISNPSDAKAGLADGTYQAVVTIPKNFSAAATSAGQTLSGTDASAQKATISVETAPDALIVDDAITSQITNTAASLMGRTLSSTTLKNVFIGYSTLGDKIGEAADGADQLAAGAGSAANGASALSSGLGQLSAGAAKIGNGTAGLASGAGSLSNGLKSWSAGATSAADGLDTWAGGAQTLAANSDALTGNLTKIADGLAAAPTVPQQAVDAANALAANRAQITQQLSDAKSQIDALAASCAASGASPAFCDQVTAAAAQSDTVYPTLQTVVGQSDQIAAGVAGLSQLQSVGKNLQKLAGGYTQISGGYTGLATGAQGAASGVRQLADGAASLAQGGAQLAGGASQLATGADQLASGASTSADGAASLASGVTKLADGTGSLASGLHQASDALPSMTDKQAADVATVLADPVSATGGSGSLFGASAIPLLATVALWFGALASFIVLQAVSRRALPSRRPSALLALRSLAPAAAIGAVQGLLVATVAQIAASYDAGTWSLFAALCVVAGVAFAAVNQALVAVLGGAGRWVSALVGVLAVATGVVSTVPAVLVGVASVMPTAPAANAMLGALTTAGGVGAGIAGLAIWAVLAFCATTIAVSRRRTVTVRALRAAPVAP